MEVRVSVYLIVIVIIRRLHNHIWAAQGRKTNSINQVKYNVSLSAKVTEIVSSTLILYAYIFNQ